MFKKYACLFLLILALPLTMISCVQKDEDSTTEESGESGKAGTTGTISADTEFGVFFKQED